MTKERKVWRIEGKDFNKINEMEKMYSEGVKDALERIKAYGNKEFKQVDELKNRMWKEVYAVLGIDPDVGYTMGTEARDAGIILIREKVKGKEADEDESGISTIREIIKRAIKF